MMLSNYKISEAGLVRTHFKLSLSLNEEAA